MNIKQQMINAKSIKWKDTEIQTTKFSNVLIITMKEKIALNDQILYQR